ncbi:TPA: 15-cis-phytoene synthase CrtB [Citrobacter freundii]
MNQNGLLEHAEQTIATGSKSFASAARLFDATTRRSVLMLYTWCRHCDDVIDGQVMGFPSQESAAAGAEQRLRQLEEQTRLVYTGAPPSDPAFAAFQEVAARHAIEPELAFDHLQGFAMDVRETRYETLNEMLGYCYHVAGVVGLMMARVMGVRNEAVLDRACDLGLAFQMTNIARDIVEDARAGRCYLPAEWLAEEKMTVDEIVSPGRRENLARLAQRLVAEAEPYYLSAHAGLKDLPLRSAWAIASAQGVYRKIGLKVCDAGPRAWDSRQGTQRLEKIALLLQGALQAVSSRVETPPPHRPAHLWQRPRGAR